MVLDKASRCTQRCFLVGHNASITDALQIRGIQVQHDAVKVRKYGRKIEPAAEWLMDPSPPIQELLFTGRLVKDQNNPVPGLNPLPLSVGEVMHGGEDHFDS